ncbi:MAG: hypothetical protein K2X38_17790 [Gemmataceae bacterium]|nr:hypothetical protein [Gemmataceae bacterium]
MSVWFIENPNATSGKEPAIHPVHFTLPVLDADFSAQAIDALIGRDILDRCNFSYNGMGASPAFRLEYGSHP